MLNFNQTARCFLHMNGVLALDLDAGKRLIQKLFIDTVLFFIFKEYDLRNFFPIRAFAQRLSQIEVEYD